ncbi:MAG: bifunctional oligoribonuclease/PAP phosphatase NrnA [Oscillospiraceae bacterium]|nr:bifunctional oligoribonuclease/PAP phosphatase NrnA [Oscillospiraceae bacterium]
MKIELSEAAEFLRSRDNYLILMHASPDGDTLGCGSALCGALQQLGKKARVQCPEAVPAKFDYMQEAYEKQEFDYETVVTVDVADSKLLGELRAVGDTAELCLDHHETNTGYAKRLVLRADYASACELVYELLLQLGTNITVPIANALYTGMATDTGCFKYSNTTPQTHIYAARLIELGAQIAPINYAMFDMKTQGRLKLEQMVLSGIKYYALGHVALINVSLEMLASVSGVDSDDVGALASIPRQIAGVDIGICIKEKKPGLFKVSLRSSENINVADIAAQFGGGGHARSSGCSFEGVAYEEAQRLISDACVEACRKAGLI